MTSPKKILQHELIGLVAEVVDAKNKSNIGIKGIIKDETKYTLMIGKKRIMKKQTKIKIKNMLISGEKLVGRHSERVK